MSVAAADGLGGTCEHHLPLTTHHSLTRAHSPRHVLTTWSLHLRASSAQVPNCTLRVLVRRVSSDPAQQPVGWVTHLNDRGIPNLMKGSHAEPAGQRWQTSSPEMRKQRTARRAIVREKAMRLAEERARLAEEREALLLAAVSPAASRSRCGAHAARTLCTPVLDAKSVCGARPCSHTVRAQLSVATHDLNNCLAARRRRRAPTCT